MTAMYQIAKKRETPSYPADLSVPAADFLDRCLSIVPEERWTALQLMSHPWLA